MANRLWAPDVDERLVLAAGRVQWTQPNRTARVNVWNGTHVLWEGELGGNSESHSPLVPLLAAGWYEWIENSPLTLEPSLFDAPEPLLNERVVFVLCGFLFGWSLWHVARRLYGNSGGYIALALYSFSPLMIVASATVGHDLIAAWGMFGAVFTAIALAHTLLAPPADRIRRTLLLGVALGMGVGADYSVAIVLLIALALMLYLTPQRRAAGMTWLALAAGMTALMLWAAFFFDAGAMLAALDQARFFALRPAYVSGGIPCDALVRWLLATLPALALLGLALLTFFRFQRSRYFGNALPLMIGGPLFLMSLATPYYLSVKYLLWALPFLYLFGAGVFADLLEEPQSRSWARAVVVAALVLNAVLCIGFLREWSAFPG